MIPQYSLKTANNVWIMTTWNGMTTIHLGWRRAAEGGGGGGGRRRAAAALGNCGAVGSCMDRNTSHESRFTAADSYTFVSSL